MCPFCECTVPSPERGLSRRAHPLVTQRAALSVGFVFFSLVAIVCLVAAFVI